MIVKKEESNLEKYERISKKIENHMINKEIDLSSFKELDANGIILWKETLNNITEPSKIYDYFNFQELGANFKAEYSDVVDFKLSVNIKMKDKADESSSTFNTENDYMSVDLKIFKKGDSDSTFKDKNVNFKIKVGGLTYEQIYQFQVDAINRIMQYSGELGFEISENDFDGYWTYTNFESRTYENMTHYFLRQKGLDSIIYPHLGFSYKMKLAKTPPIPLGWDEYIFNLINYDASIEIILYPIIWYPWSGDKKHSFFINFSLKQYFNFKTNNDKMFAFLSQLTSKIKGLEQITLHKKDAINGKQLTYQDLYKKLDNMMANAFNTDAYKSAAKALGFTINFIKILFL